jgi:CO/xanthine dehydrogenase Mo-binding subunit
MKSLHNDSFPKSKWMGKPIRRIEDRRLLLADTSFVDDLDIPGMAYVAVLRSPYAHAKLLKVDASNAMKIAGVIAAIDGSFAKSVTRTLPSYAVGNLKPEEYCLAVDKVRYVGEAVAAVAATDPAIAEDALEEIEVAYEPLPAVVDPEDAMSPNSALVYDSFGTNVVGHNHAKWGDVEGAFEAADQVIKERIAVQRFSSTPLEPISVIAKYDQPSDSLTLWCNAQMTGHVMMGLSEVLNMPTNKLRLIVNDIGGGFGIKTRPWRPLLIASLLAMKTKGRPVKYVEDRREHMMAAGMTAEGIFDIEVAFKNDGKILGFRLREINNDGASLTYAGTYSSMRATLINGSYDIRNIEWDSYTVLTNQCPSMPNRGVGKPGMVYIVERMIDFVSQKLGLDPVEVRRRNFIRADNFPYVTPSGRVYDSGNYTAMLERALDVVGYEKLKKKQLEVRSENKYIGIGFATYVHGASAHSREIEGINVKVDARGNVVVKSGSPDMGTGHSTTIAQVIADELGIDAQNVAVDHFDSVSNPWTPYSGTHANKFSGPDVEVTLQAARKLREKILKIGAYMMEANPLDLEIEDGKVFVKGSPSSYKTIAEIARVAYQNPKLLPEGVEPGLEVTSIGNTPLATGAFVTDPRYEIGAQHQLVTGPGSPTSFMTYPSSAHVAVVEVDSESGQVKILRYVIVHDSGRIINPLIVQGQVHGNAVHGIGVALLEEFVYNEEGQLLTSTFADYFKPTTCEVPNIEDAHTETPSPRSSIGIKGVGEGESLGPLAALANAVEDALKPFGKNLRITSLPITPEKVYRLIKQARRGERRKELNTQEILAISRNPQVLQRND